MPVGGQQAIRQVPNDIELREDGSYEMRENGSDVELRDSA
jgi:hypothetical protein